LVVLVAAPSGAKENRPAKTGAKESAKENRPAKTAEACRLRAAEHAERWQASGRKGGAIDGWVARGRSRTAETAAGGVLWQTPSPGGVPTAVQSAPERQLKLLGCSNTSDRRRPWSEPEAGEQIAGSVAAGSGL